VKDLKLPAHSLALTLFGGVLAVWLASMAVVMRHAALPPEATGTMLAVFDPGTPEDTIFAGLTRAEARVVRQGGLSFIWIVSGTEPGLAGRLVKQGAIGAYRDLPISPTIAGCFALADAKAASLFP
jgi:hypothetical protein